MIDSINNFLLFGMMFLQLDIENFIYVKSFFIILFVFINYRSFGILWCKDFKQLNILVILLCAIYIYSDYSNLGGIKSYVGYNVSQGSPLRIVMSSFGAFFSLLYIEWIGLNNRNKKLLSNIFILFVLYLIVIDFNAFTLGHFEGSGEGGFIAGNKFNVCYANLYAAIISFLLLRTTHLLIYKYGYIILLFLTYVISDVTECSTTKIGILLLVLLSLGYVKVLDKFLSKSFVLIAVILLTSVVFLIFYSWILNLSSIQYYVVDVLGEDLTLTGRTFIYESMALFIPITPLYGFGSSNVSAIVNSVTGSYNAQNGMLQLYLGIGIIGAVIYVLILLKMNKMWNGEDQFYPFLSLLYVIIFISTIEIPYSLNFLQVLFLSIVLIKKNNVVNSRIVKVHG